ncbi:MAG: hypothetical protein MRJ92_09050 [Nitrospira sp.]|nr:hypothetical protein [Nitrospira sp.]
MRRSCPRRRRSWRERQSLPYSPKHLLTAGIGYTNRAFRLGTFNARLEAQCISDQFGDDRNLVAPTANGQRGMVRGWCMMNASVNQYVKKINTTFFFVAKNMLDQATIMDRTRGSCLVSRRSGKPEPSGRSR